MASQTDKFKKAGLATVTTLAAPGKALAATSITVGSTTNFPTGTGLIVAIRQVNTAGTLVAGTYTEWRATVTSGTSLAIEATPVAGSDQVYAAGSTTQVFVPLSSYGYNELVDGVLVEHSQTGTHTAVTATSLTASGTVQGATVVATGDLQLRSTSMETIRSETMFDYVASGGVWSGDAYASTRNASMTALTAYIGGRRGTVAAVTARAFTTSKDTYVDVLNTAGVFSLVYTEVTNNAASPALAANSIRIAIIVTGASNIAAVGSVNQGEENKVLPIASSVAYTTTDSLGNLICPRDPNRRIIGYRQLSSNFVSSTSGAHQITGLSLVCNVPVGRTAKISFNSYGIQFNAGSPHIGLISIWDGAVGVGTQLTGNTCYVATNANDYPMPSFFAKQTTSGIKTYNIGISIGSTNQKTISVSATLVTCMTVELV